MGVGMSDNPKTFRDRSQSSRDDVIAFWSSTKGLITAGVLIGAVVVGLLWGVVSDVIGALS